jgi:hypothetical protein
MSEPQIIEVEDEVYFESTVHISNHDEYWEVTAIFDTYIQIRLQKNGIDELIYIDRDKVKYLLKRPK